MQGLYLHNPDRTLKEFVKLKVAQTISMCVGKMFCSVFHRFESLPTQFFIHYVYRKTKRPQTATAIRRTTAMKTENNNASNNNNNNS